MRKPSGSIVLAVAMALAVPLAQGIAWSQSGEPCAARDREFAEGAPLEPNRGTPEGDVPAIAGQRPGMDRAHVDLLQDVTPAQLRGVADYLSRVGPDLSSIQGR